MLGNMQRMRASAVLRQSPAGRGWQPLRRSLHKPARVFEETKLKKIPGEVRSNVSMTQPAIVNNLSSVAQEVAYSGVWGAIKTFPKRRPFAFNFLLSGSMMPLADYFIQKSQGGKVDWRRNAFFCLFGLYNGTMWWVVYVNMFSKLFPKAITFSNLTWAGKLADKAGQRQLLGQVIADVFVYTPLVYFPVFYIFKTQLQGEAPIAALDRVKDNFVEDNTASICFNGPMDLAVFAAPVWLRMPLTHGYAFFWNLLLSWKRGNFQE